jgi:hypothetical protein
LLKKRNKKKCQLNQLKSILKILEKKLAEMNHAFVVQVKNINIAVVDYRYEIIKIKETKIINNIIKKFLSNILFLIFSIIEVFIDKFFDISE